MLDTATKRRIDTARDILVGKLPDPKSQVEQITVALIYKFMDDMDAQSEEFGGERTFFSGEFQKYGWARLMRGDLGGHEKLNLYAEAITRMPQNPGIPPLFRDIFKNAFLPYRDPETLRAFLKVIDEFEYDHSERLGDAFEYLLSVLGSQGDAGQFRTPRHIIDFIVEIIDPKKDETVLDPACGTAGFLISAYKHILKANTDEHGNSTLTPDERQKLATNFRGYDISPDMVRLSLVNMYLHGFPDPQIHEYDTLTSLDRWNEHADVILANPPFMSPKGGIQPHNRFSVQSKRSEVLFVDYIAEHLSPKGRAGIIVPEGILFQSQTAYRDLRKLLVEEYVVAVISLPPGVFNPYSGVKTSVLILDRTLAKLSGAIAFFKITNDGFDLGAQRRATRKNDLPAVRAEIAEYMRRAPARDAVEDFMPALGLVVLKAKLAANGDYNLSGERYRERAAGRRSFPLIRLGDGTIFRVESGGTPKSHVEEYWGGGIPWATLVDLPPSNFITQISSTKRTISEKGLRESSATMIPANSVIVSTRATIGRIAINRLPIATNQGFKNVVIRDPQRAVPEYVAIALTKLVPTMQAWATGGTFAEISKARFCELEIPLPPLDVQNEMVAEIEEYLKVIDGARAVLDNYRPRFYIHPDWPRVPIKEVASVESGYGFPLDYQGRTDEEIPFLKVSDMNLPGNEKEIISWSHSVSRDVLRELKGSAFPKGTVIFPKIGAAIATNKKRILTRDSTYDNNVMGIVPDTRRLLPGFLHTYLLGIDISRWASESQPPSMRKTTVEAHEIPVPPLATQEATVAQIEAEQALVAANRELAARFQSKVQAVLARVWGEAGDSTRVISS